MFRRDNHDIRLLKKPRMTLFGAVDGTENLIEKVNYEALRLKVDGHHQDLVEELHNLRVGDTNLGLRKRESSTSMVVESEIFGGKNEIKELMSRLLSVNANGKNLTVIPIVGMAGIGKTTLAKPIYNDESVKTHFDLSWICVSEPYDVLGITKELLREIGLKVDDNMNQLQIKLKECLKGKKFLISLDDVWTDNYKEWDDLRSLFVQGDVGSHIIVSMMNNEKIIPDILSSEVSWSLFKIYAFENMDPKDHPELEEVGKQISSKCNGLPLALKTLAGMLRSKSEVEGWKCILRSEIWELPNNDILAALKLSYNDLPAHLKRCFSYCAIFPKDYPFRKDQVIQLWNANGLVRGSKFLMHDLVNDLAQITSSKLCIRLEDYKGSHMLEKS
ncbi:unnamed protein product [Withania somnifera]